MQNDAKSGVGKCPFLGVLNISSKYLLEMNPQCVGDDYMGHLPTPVNVSGPHWTCVKYMSIMALDSTFVFGIRVEQSAQVVLQKGMVYHDLLVICTIYIRFYHSNI